MQTNEIVACEAFKTNALQYNAYKRPACARQKLVPKRIDGCFKARNEAYDLVGAGKKSK